jgi:hypothetical protein
MVVKEEENDSLKGRLEASELEELEQVRYGRSVPRLHVSAMEAVTPQTSPSPPPVAARVWHGPWWSWPRRHS